jgi:hypothetical protein
LCTDDANNYEEEEPPGDELKVRVDFINLIILADVEEEEGEDPDDEEDPLGQEDIVDEEEEEEPPPKIKRVGIDLRNDRILIFFNLN